MVFSSMVFLWIFLPVVLVLTWVAPARLRNILLLLASLLFYAWGEPVYLFLLLSSIALNYLVGVWMEKAKRPGVILTLGLIADLGLLSVFKYSNFVLNTLDHLLPFVQLPRTGIALPIGISFFTFQAMSYLIDLYRGHYKAQKNPLDLALYISFFPQLIAGPIVRYVDVEAQIRNRTMTVRGVAFGFRRFIYGFGKKVILANILAESADALFSLPATELSGGAAWLAAILYSLQLYYDFSGYSDMAIGLGRMFGFEFLENFDYPYLSTSIHEFWQRWHMSLGTWFREYVYFPLGGNRKGKMRTYVNLILVFALTGLWHGASWNFVGWGLYHGAFQILERLGLGRFLKRHPALAHVYTVIVFVVGWVFFRVESVTAGFTIVGRMIRPWLPGGPSLHLGALFTTQGVLAFMAAILGAGLIQALLNTKRLTPLRDRLRYSAAEAIYLIAVLAVGILLLAGNTYNPFIYFRF